MKLNLAKLLVAVLQVLAHTRVIWDYYISPKTFQCRANVCTEHIETD